MTYLYILAGVAIALAFVVFRLIFGPRISDAGEVLGFWGRMLHGWFYSDDPMYDRIDRELRRAEGRPE